MTSTKTSGGSTVFPLFAPSIKTLLVSLGMVFAFALSVAQSLELGDFVNRLGSDSDDLLESFILLLAISVAAPVADTFLTEWLPLRIQLGCEMGTAKRLVKLMLSSPLEFYQRHDRGYYLNIVTNSAPTYGAQWSMTNIWIVGRALCIALTLLVSFFIQPLYCLLFAIYIPVYCLVMSVPNRIVSSLRNSGLPSQDEYLDAVKRIVEEKRSINIARADDEYYFSFDRAANRYQRFIVRLRYYSTLTEGLPTLLSCVLQVVTLGVSILLFVDGEISLGTILTAWQISNIIQSPIVNLFSQHSYVKTNLAHVDRLREFEFESSSRSRLEGNYDKMVRLFELRGLFYSTSEHSERTRLFSAHDISAEKNTLVVIKGKNGSGKSLLVDYLAGYAEAAHFEGEVSVDYSLRHCAYLTYPIIALEGSVVENMFGSEVDQELVHVLHAEELIERTIEENAQNLSFGERQKLALIRVLAEKKQPIILDEPLTNLDAASADGLIRYIKNRKGKQSIICIMHSPELDSDADLVLTISEGRLVPLRSGVTLSS